MLLAQGVMNLVLELDVRTNFAGAARRRVQFHDPTILMIDSRGTARPADFTLPLTR
jgi:hypothetical protein